jgi:tetratricopeptide (TPR) repeat protein
MMWKPIFLLLFVFNLSCPSFGIPRESDKDSVVLLQLADHLFASQAYYASITEYWRFLFFHSDHPYAFYAYYKAAMGYSALNDHEMAITLLRRGLRLNMTERYRERIRYQLALVTIANQNYQIAELELFKLSQSAGNNDIGQAATVLSALVLVHERKWEKAQDFIQRSIHSFQDRPKLLGYLEQIRMMMEQPVRSPQKKSPALAKWMSTFLPGSGQIYSGRLLDGINAFALNAVTTCILWQTIQQKNIQDASLWFWLIWLRYYTGNRSHAEEAAIRTNQSYQETISRQIYQLFQDASSYMSKEPLTIELQDLMLPVPNQ